MCGELYSLIRVEDLRLALHQARFLRVQAEATVQGVRQAPGQHVAAVLVHDRDQVHEAPVQRDVRDVRAPDLIGPGDR